MELTAKSNDVYFVTLTVVEWIDIFTRPIYKDLIIDNLIYCQKNKGLDVFSYVIMTNHIHMIARSNVQTMSDFLRDFKGYTSNQIFKLIENNEKESRKEWMLKIFRKAGKNNVLNKNHQFWQNLNYPILVDKVSIFEKKRNYIHHNPVKAEIVARVEDYVYSSANLDSPLKILEY
jgi:REP-associated tyrosine transposase